MVINNKIKSTTLLFLLITCLVFSQDQITKDNPDGDFWSNVRFGGGLGLNFGDGFFNATIAPSGIYEFNDRFALGLGLNATFINQRNTSKSTVLGGSIISLFNIIPELQISAEFEHLNVDTNYNVNLNIKDENYWVPALYLGVGYRSNNATIGLRYDLLYNNEKSLYLNAWMPFLRFYF